MKNRIEYVIVLTPRAGNYRTSPEQRLRAALKCLLRGYGWRCVSAKRTSPPEDGKPC
jgi:hypothetical protein